MKHLATYTAATLTSMRWHHHRHPPPRKLVHRRHRRPRTPRRTLRTLVHPNPLRSLARATHRTLRTLARWVAHPTRVEEALRVASP